MLFILQPKSGSNVKTLNSRQQSMRLSHADTVLPKHLIHGMSLTRDIPVINYVLHGVSLNDAPRFALHQAIEGVIACGL